MQLQPIIPHRGTDILSTIDGTSAVRLPGGTGALLLGPVSTRLDSEQGQNPLDAAFEEAERRKELDEESQRAELHDEEREASASGRPGHSAELQRLHDEILKAADDLASGTTPNDWTVLRLTAPETSQARCLKLLFRRPDDEPWWKIMDQSSLCDSLRAFHDDWVTVGAEACASGALIKVSRELDNRVPECQSEFAGLLHADRCVTALVNYCRFRSGSQHSTDSRRLEDDVSPIFTFVCLQRLSPSEPNGQERRPGSFPPLPVRAVKSSCTVAQLQEKVSLIQRDEVKASQVLVSQLTVADIRTFNSGRAPLTEPQHLDPEATLLLPKGMVNPLTGESLRYGVQILIKTLTGKKFVLDVFSDEDIRSLKDKIQMKGGVPPDQQRIIFCGMQLEEALASGHTIRAESVMHLVVRL